MLLPISSISNFRIEVELGKSAVGTTKKGIGPTYSSRADRSGATLDDIFDDELLETKLRRMADGYRKRYGDLLSKYDVEEEITRFKTYREKLTGLIVDEVPLLRSVKANGLKMVVEGAQAAGLDITFGVSHFFRLNFRSNRGRPILSSRPQTALWVAYSQALASAGIRSKKLSELSKHTPHV
jgi:adenylosuccinate synthase